MIRLGERNSNIMTNSIKKIGYKIGMFLAFMPLFAIPTADTDIMPGSILLADKKAKEIEVSIQDLRQERADKIDAYYGRYDLPLTGYGMKMVLASEKYGVDWNLIPAIAMRESTGGKFACYNNPFGWGSCKIKYNSFDEAIEAIARNLGGANSRTSYYYAGKTTAEKLYYYNGTVIASYPKEVMKIMTTIDKMKLGADDNN
jgi:hypothetical protein